MFVKLAARFILILFVIGTACGITYWLMSGEAVLAESSERVGTLQASRGLPESSENSSPGADEPEQSLLSLVWQAVTAGDFLDTQRWVQETGQFVEEDLEVYQSYALETLREMALEGDLRAITVLARKLRGYGAAEDARVLVIWGAIHGSIGLLLEQARLEVYPPHVLARSVDPDFTFDGWRTLLESERRYIEALAFVEVARIRGDRNRVDDHRRHVINVFEQMLERELDLTEQDWALVNARAREIYAELQAERHRQGLGDFDNRTPLIEELVHQQMKKDKKGK